MRTFPRARRLVCPLRSPGSPRFCSGAFGRVSVASVLLSLPLVEPRGGCQSAGSAEPRRPPRAGQRAVGAHRLPAAAGVWAAAGEKGHALVCGGRRPRVGNSEGAWARSGGGGTEPWSPSRAEDPPLAVGCSGTQVTGTAQGRLLPGRRSWRLRAGQIRSEISHAFDLRPCFPRSTQLAQSEQWAALGPRACV